MKLIPGEQVRLLPEKLAVFPFPDDFPRPAIVTDVSNDKAEKTLAIFVNGTHVVMVGALPGKIGDGANARYRMCARFGRLEPGFQLDQQDRAAAILPHIAGLSLDKIRADRSGLGIVMEFNAGAVLVLVNNKAVTIAK